MEKPKIRPVEAFPIDHGGQTLICLRDPSGMAPEPVLISMGAYFIVTLFDGANTLLDIQAAFAQRFGDILSGGKLKELIGALDGAYFLDSPAFAGRVRDVREAFSRSPRREAALAGLCYERDPVKLRGEIEAWFDSPGGPGRAAAVRKDGNPVAGLISPHIDPRRGGPVYAHAYAELVGREPPELVVILGTSHYGTGPELFAATRKDYGTPLGAVGTDGDFIERVAARYGAGDLFADELLHRNEHSIEFQALFLARVLGTSGYRIAPILVGSFHEMVVGGVSPARDPRVSSFVEALRAELADERRRVLIVAGVDFAHVGRKFGDAFGVNATVAGTVRRDDLELIDQITHGDPAAFFTRVQKDGDRRRICGLAPIYTLLELLRGRPGRLLKYDIALEPQTDSAVSFAGIAID